MDNRLKYIIKKFIRIDVEENRINGFVIRGDGTLLCRESVDFSGGGDILCGFIVDLINRMISAVGGYKTDIRGAGISCAGKIDGKKGAVLCESLNMRYYPLAKLVSDKTGLTVTLASKENAVKLGEFGAAALLM